MDADPHNKVFESHDHATIVTGAAKYSGAARGRFLSAAAEETVRRRSFLLLLVVAWLLPLVVGGCEMAAAAEISIVLATPRVRQSQIATLPFACPMARYPPQGE